MATTVLYRPVGPAEMRLIAQSGFQRFPPRLPEQPIFYPVCSERYAIEIAQRWNARDDGGGYVTRFAVRSPFLAKYTSHVVGARHHEEYWIPSDDLEAFNEAIVGEIEVVREFPPAAVIEARKELFENYVVALETRSVVASKEDGPHRCPCCHFRTLSERGGFEICPVCFWEDDGQDDADADAVRGGPNGNLSLSEARENFTAIGACEGRSLGAVRPPTEEER
jgi:Cysteine-rich CPCC